MTHSMHAYVASLLDNMLRDRRVVVFYDPRREFTRFVEELDVVGTGRGDLPRVCIHDTLTHVARFDGSVFALKAAVEPVVAHDKPDPLLVYLPGVPRDRKNSVLMELEAAGSVFGDAPSHSLRSLARRQLRTRFTDGAIDEMLTSESLTYEDVARLMTQEGETQSSLVKLVLGEGSSEELISRWLASEEHDSDLEAKSAVGELFKLVQARLGLVLESGTSLAKARHQTLRFVLINEFRSDLECDAPTSLEVVPEPPTKAEQQRLRVVAEQLRRDHGATYVTLADSVETEFSLASLGIDASLLGAIDTFRFEERLFLERAAQLVVSGDYGEAAEVVAARQRSFWVDNDLSRLSQWELARLMADLGQEVARVLPLVKKCKGPPRVWVEAYAGDWYRVDRAQRAMESWRAKMDDEPEGELDRAIELLRRSHESLLKEMSQGYSASLAEAGWTVSGVLHHTGIYPALVETAGGRVAYFFVDAMRFEMAADLLDQLAGTEELRLVPAIAALPSITQVGMAALLPGASASFSVVEHREKLAARIGKTVMPGLAERMRYLKAIKPEAQDIDLGELLDKSTRALKKKLKDSPLIVVRSQSIDGLGEMDGGLLARQIMDTVVQNLARAVRKLAKLGVEFFVITADHGHQFSVRKAEDMLMDKPGGETVDQHRRCWAGRGGQTPAAARRVTGGELGYDTDLDFIFPSGLAVFRAGGDLAFHHGGVSLQEMVVPVVTLRVPASAPSDGAGPRVVLDGVPEELTNRTFGLRISVAPELFTTDPLPVRLVLVADGLEVGQAGMALDAEFDRTTGTVLVPLGKTVNVAMILARDDKVKTLRIVAQDPATDAVLAQSADVRVKLGI